jgi:general secretion pathway protein C
MFETLTFRDTATAGLMALVAVTAARLVWTIVEPIGPIGLAPPTPPPEAGAAQADFAALGRFDPFHRTPVSMGAAAPAGDTAGFRLFAVRTAGAGGGSAIVAGPDGRQASFAVGSEVAPGVTLASIAADHVVLSSGGRRSSLHFPASTPGAAPPPPYMPPPALPASVPGVAPPSLTPSGFTLQPGAPGADYMALAGLQPGDVITSVNGKGLSGVSNPDELGLAQGEEAVIQYERAGEVRTATLKVPSP